MYYFGCFILKKKKKKGGLVQIQVLGLCSGRSRLPSPNRSSNPLHWFNLKLSPFGRGEIFFWPQRLRVTSFLSIYWDF